MHAVDEFLPENKIKMLKRQQYALFGHSAVKICHYTKSTIQKNKFCYKFNFYGIRSHRCIQMTPSSNFCNQECTFCWRTLGWNKKDPDIIDEPNEIVDESIKMQNKLLSGFGGMPNPTENNKLFYEESKEPRHVAISLTGEPTLYKKLPELIEEYRKKNFSTFLVTNGTMPEVVEKCKPTQLYVSLDATSKEMHKAVNRPMESDAWERLMRTLEIMATHPSRTVIRITAINGHNMDKAEEYAYLIKKANPMFIEAKGYSWIGFSRKRLKKENAPTFDEVGKFADALSKATGYPVKNSVKDARVYLLVRPDIADKPTWIDYTKV